MTTRDYLNISAVILINYFFVFLLAKRLWTLFFSGWNKFLSFLFLVPLVGVIFLVASAVVLSALFASGVFSVMFFMVKENMKEWFNSET